MDLSVADTSWVCLFAISRRWLLLGVWGGLDYAALLAYSHLSQFGSLSAAGC